MCHSPSSYFQWRRLAAASCSTKKWLSFFFLFFFSAAISTYLKAPWVSNEHFLLPKRRGKQLFPPDAACWMECKYVNHPEFITFECSSNATADTSLIYDIPLIMRAVEIISQAASSLRAATLSVPLVHRTRTRSGSAPSSTAHGSAKT